MPDSLKDVRLSLKLSLLNRGEWTRAGFRPTCAVCGQPIFEAPEMHEAILDRAKWMGLPLELIMVPENCVLVHPGGKNAGACHLRAHTGGGTLACIQHLEHHVGRERILAWLESLRGYVRSGVINEAVRSIKER